MFKTYPVLRLGDEMKSNITEELSCNNNFFSYVAALVLLLLALPFHLLIMKILALNFRFENPRHVILFCLSASDSLQVAFVCLAMIIFQTETMELGSQPCTTLRRTIIYFASLTFIVSSFSLVALSVERYIACFHGFYIHEWLANRRTVPALVAFWICGIIVSGIVCFSGSRDKDPVIFASSDYFQAMFVSITFPVSIVLITVQSLLFYLSRKKLMAVQPSVAVSSSNRDESFAKKKQFKLAMVAGMVVLSYLMCTLPGACVILANQYIEPERRKIFRGLLSASLGMLNTLLNPFIYGLGMLDTRKAISRELRKIKNYILIKLGLRDELNV